MSRNVPKHDFKAAQGVSRHFGTVLDAPVSSPGLPDMLVTAPNIIYDYWLRRVVARCRNVSKCLEYRKFKISRHFETLRPSDSMEKFSGLFGSIDLLDGMSGQPLKAKWKKSDRHVFFHIDFLKKSFSRHFETHSRHFETWVDSGHFETLPEQQIWKIGVRSFQEHPGLLQTVKLSPSGGLGRARLFGWSECRRRRKNARNDFP